MSKENSTKKFSIAEEDLPERYVDVTILGNEYRMKLLQIVDIITHNTLGRYLNVTDCAFLHYCNVDVLAIDIRKEPEDVEEVTLIITEIFSDDRHSLLGFVINDVEEFSERISFAETKNKKEKLII